MQEMQLCSLGQEVFLEKEMANYFSYSCLGNPMDRGAWWATVHGIAELDMIQQLNNNKSRGEGAEEYQEIQSIIPGE